MKISMNISGRLLLLFLLFTVLPLALFSYLNLQDDEATLRAVALDRMSDLADKKAIQVKSYLAEQVQDVSFLARGPQVMEAISTMPREYAPGRLNAAKYIGEDALLRQYFDRYVEETKMFYDVFLITPQGEVIYTQKHEADFATNLLAGPWRDSQLAEAFRTARMTLEPVISGYEYYSPSSAPALFIAAPIMVDGKFKGVFAVQLGNELLYKVATDATGLGLSGEAAFAQRDGDGLLVTTPLKHRPDAALKLRLNRQESQQVPMLIAISGNAGAGATVDYRGKPEIAAWRYLPELGWGLVVKEDADEVFASIHQQRIIMLETVLGLLLFAGLAAYYFGRQISVPLKGLVQTADEVANGNLDKRADESAPGELGLFARAFNNMAENLQGLYRTLEKRIDERTVELTQSMAALRIKEAAIASSINAIAIAGLDGKLSYVNQAFVDLWRLQGPEDAIGRSPTEFWDKPQDAQIVMEVLPQQGHWQGEMRARRLDGSLADLQLSAHLVMDEAGNPLCMMGSFLDITARKQAEADMLIARNQLVATIDAIPDLMFDVGLDGTYHDIYAQRTDLLAAPADSLIGKKVSDVLPAEAAEVIMSALLVANEQGRSYGKQFELPLLQGKSWFELSVSRKPAVPGQQPRFIVLSREITERKYMEQSLQRNQDLLNEAQRLGHLGSWELDLLSGELRWSDEIYRIFELDPKQFTPSYKNFLNAVHPEDRDLVNRAYTQSLADRQAYDIEHRLRMADGRIKWVHEHCRSDFDELGKPLRSVGAVQDITRHKLIEDRLHVAAVAFETHEAIMITDANANIIRVNRAFLKLTGYSSEEVQGKNPSILSSGRQDKVFYEDMWKQLHNGGSWSGELWDRRKDGLEYPKWLTITAVENELGEVTGYVGIFADISERKQAEEEIRNLAFYDSLTKLPNRRLLLDRFHSALSLSVRSNHYGAVLFLDLDRFKTINDNLGHDLGDRLLIEVGRRIHACVREMDTVARLGGDEFVILVEEINVNAQEASQKIALIAEKIRSALTQPYLINGHEYHSSPSIGVCLYHGNEESAEDLLKHADMAMYHAKESGRNMVRFFDPAMQQSVEKCAALELDLRHAVSLRQLRLHYQVQLDNDHRPLGAEALLRWIHPTRGMVAPAQFIPLAEETMLILEIGYWVLESACQQLKLWEQHARTRDLTIAVNVSAQQFAMQDFVGQVAAVLHKHSVDPARLKLELTESVVLDDVQGTVAIMHALKGLGVALSMDDFGTGYSSLSYLKLLPLDQLKIDQSFIRDITSNPNDAVMVKTIIDMARNFRLNVIAEGVETEAQLAFLKQHGCMAYQGYLFSRPVPIEEFEALLDGV